MTPAGTHGTSVPADSLITGSAAATASSALSSRLVPSSSLTTVIGTPTDSRSLLSYSRHEYYRRILCNFIGNLVENGEYPADMKTLGKLVEDISYNNACRYFAF